MSNTTSDTIWHYTSMEAFLHIIRTRSLFFSSAAHLNDSREIAWVEEVLNNGALDDGTLDEDSVNLLRDCVPTPDYALRNSPFIASFSMQPDKLSQWRAYADDGKGIAIGFGKDWLIRNLDERYTNNGLTLFHQRVEYLSPSASCTEIWNMMRRTCEEYRNQFTLAGDNRPIHRLATYYVKNDAFEEEEEYRICYEPRARPPNTSIEGPHEKFRTAHDGRLVPYVEFDLAKSECKLPITGIVLGPRNVNHVEVIKQFLWKSDHLTPKIETSKATYRR